MSVTDGTLTTDAAQQTVRIAGTVNVNTTGGGTGGATKTQIVGANGTNTADVSASGNLFVQVSNTSLTSNQGTAASIGSAWPTKVTDGSNVAVITGSAAGIGAGLVTTTGSITAQTSLNALTAVGPGVVVDFGSARARITGVTTATAGVTAGATTLMVSQDSSNWFPGTAQTFTAPGVKSDTIQGAFRYARVDVTTTVTGGTVSATLMAS